MAGTNPLSHNSIHSRSVGRGARERAMGLARVSSAAVVCLLTAAAAAAPPPPLHYSTVALTGRAAPGTAAGVSYASFTTPEYNAAGQLSFAVTLAGTGVTASNDTAIYAGPFAAPQLVARE